ncbi:MAG TPA: P-loop NTPase fold protein, partial [bacterium]|nr:P-loop NTPase fold protein [bacterium]
FQNDFNDDPFVALSSHIISCVNGRLSSVRKFKKTAVNVGAALSGVLVKGGAGFLSAGAVKGNDLEKVSDALFSGSSDLIQGYIKEKFNLYKKAQSSLDSLKSSLSEVIQSFPNKKLVFIIDELDRCRPDYAIGVLERIKHFFEVDGLIFVIAMNRKQIESYVEGQFGSGVDANLYLQKFINYECSLPKESGAYGRTPDLVKFCTSYYVSHDFVDKEGNTDRGNELFHPFCRVPSFLAKVLKMTPREIQDSMRNIAVCHSCIPGYDGYSTVLVAFLSVIKVKRPTLYTKFKELSVSLDDLSEFKFLENKGSDATGVSISSNIKFNMGFDLEPDENDYLRSRNISSARSTPDKNVFPEICGYIELFSPGF